MKDENNNFVLIKSRNNFRLLLIIAIIFFAIVGGTFAYFTATATNNILTGNMAKIDLNLTVTKMLPQTNKTDDILVINYTELADSLNAKCIDKDGEFALCQLYKINLANSNTGVNTNVKGSLSFNNENVPNLSWLYLGNSYNSSTPYTSSMLGNSFNTASSSYTNFIDGYLLTAGTNIDFYILTWVNETEDEQIDQGSYSAVVRFEDTNGNGVTATFND